MLISQMQAPFDDADWIYELKLDGCRCVAYLEEGRVVLRNKRNMELLDSEEFDRRYTVSALQYFHKELGL